MAVTGRNAIAVFVVLAGLVFCKAAENPMEAVAYVAKALAAGDASDAMTPFDKSCPAYDKLTRYFTALAGFQVVNEVDLTDEEDTDERAKLTVNWTITLTNPQSNSTERRTGELKVAVVRKSGKWKIVEFGPIEIFDPMGKR